jgi:hypothetical protein
MELGKANLALKYGEAKKQLYQSERTGAQTSIDTDSDVDMIRLRHEGTNLKILPAGVNRNYLKFAGICIGNEGKVSAVLVKAVTGDRSKLTNRMIPFLNLNSPLVTLQNKLVIQQWAAGERSLYNHLARGHSEEQAREAFEQAEILSAAPTKSSSSSLRAPSTQGSREGTRSRRSSRSIMEATTCPR